MQAIRPRRIAIVVAVLLLGALAATVFAYRHAIAGYGAAGTAYGARVGCSCRFVAGRSLDDCAKDKVAGMALVHLSENDSARSVTATMPLVASDTARYRAGYGCVLDPYDG